MLHGKLLAFQCVMAACLFMHGTAEAKAGELKAGSSLHHTQAFIEEEIRKSPSWNGISFDSGDGMGDAGEARLSMDKEGRITSCQVLMNPSHFKTYGQKMLYPFVLLHESAHCADNDALPHADPERLFYKEVLADAFATLMLIRLGVMDESLLEKIAFFKKNIGTDTEVRAIHGHYTQAELKGKSTEEILVLAKTWREKRFGHLVQSSEKKSIMASQSRQ